MPTRLLREGILDSERVNSLSIEAELFYRRLMSVVDDYGRYEASPAKLRPRLFPLRLHQFTDKDVLAMLNECLANDKRLLTLYEVNGKRYVEIIDFKQQLRSPSKYPEPTKENVVCLANDKQCLAVVHLGVSVSEGVSEEEHLCLAKTKKTRKRTITTPEFDEFWSEYWRPEGGKPPALRAFRNNIDSPEEFALMMAQLRKERPAQLEVEVRYRKHPGSWLNAQTWRQGDTPIPNPNGNNGNGYHHPMLENIPYLKEFKPEEYDDDQPELGLE